MNIFIDLDGVLVDLEKGYSKATGIELSESDKFYNYDQSLVWSLPKANPRFWLDLEKTSGCDDLLSVAMECTCNKYVLSAAVSDYPLCSLQKRLWVTRNTTIPIENVHVVRRSEKKLFAFDSKNQVPNLLIDDYEKNIEEWEKCGGIGIHHTDINNTLLLLRSYIRT
jgi:hypothetical protein